MEKITEENAPWSREMQMGSHRYPIEWVDDRYSWLVDGKPTKPDWQEVMTDRGRADLKKQIQR